MTICNVLQSISIDDNTAIVVDGSRELFRSGMVILDDHGQPHEVTSVGMDNIDAYVVANSRVSLLIKGALNSSKIYI